MMERERVSSSLLFALATAFGASSTVQAYYLIRLSAEAPGYSLAMIAVLNLVYWYIPAFLAPFIMAFARSQRLRSAVWPVQVAVHAAGAIGYAVTHTSIMLAVKAVALAGAPEVRDALFSTLVSPGWGTYAVHEFLLQLDWLLMTYLFLVGLSFALAFRRESEEAAVRAATLHARLVEAQLQALQRQLHPHFLFNTLNTISGLIQTDPKAADVMIDRLGDLLRMTLRTSDVQEVPLKDELEVLQKYLEIEQTRFGDRLHVTFDIEPETLDACVPNFLLQPLVENAIRHGIAPKTRPGWLVVHVNRDADELALDVRDSGGGVPPDRLLALNGGVGLENTRARLEHLYRSQFSLRFANVPGGFSVSIRIPFKPDPSVRRQVEYIA